MGKKCCVPHCYTGYRKYNEKHPMYGVPKDDFFLNKWQDTIARADRLITPNDCVCQKHFREEDFLRTRFVKGQIEEYKVPRLRPDAVPSVFPDIPESIHGTVKKRRKLSVDDELYKNNLEKMQKEVVNDGKIGEFHLNDIKMENKLDNNDNDIKQEFGCDLINDSSQNSAIEMCETVLNDEIHIKSEEAEIIEDNGPKMFKCDHCPYQTKWPQNLQIHQTKHLEGEEHYHRCEKCPSFKTKWLLTYKNHVKLKHGSDPPEIFKCQMCKYETKVKLCLKRHTDRHNRDIPDKQYHCDNIKSLDRDISDNNSHYANIERHDVSEKNDHGDDIVPEKMYDCDNKDPDISDKNDHSDRDLSTKTYHSHNIERHDCDLSDEKYHGDTGERYDRDISDKTYHCDIDDCNFASDLKTLYEYHKKTHKENGKKKQFCCTECFFETDHQNNLIKHVKSAHCNGDEGIALDLTVKKRLPIEERQETMKFKCMKCNYHTNSHTWLLKHIFKHTYETHRKKNSNVFRCVYCPYVTYFPDDLENHHKEHFRARNSALTCNECSLECGTKTEYIRHTLMHRNISIEKVNVEKNGFSSSDDNFEDCMKSKVAISSSDDSFEDCMRSRLRNNL